MKIPQSVARAIVRIQDFIVYRIWTKFEPTSWAKDDKLFVIVYKYSIMKEKGGLWN